MSLKDYLQSNSQPAPSFFSHTSDLFLALGVVAIVTLMVLPVPPLMLDVLVAINIVFGLVLVLMGVYITSPLQFSAFPSVLLISTLYRLALSVATTRMILLHGDAGNIVDTFGNLVAGGNLIVGLVVFLIITLVQFIVIAKGAERVAEVSARFSLDAMPGKQLSIDSDLRSGLLDKEGARQKRREIELEAKFHGSMDGAMKFVKGDAIAGIVITIINLLGGLAIGMLQLDMSASAAMAKYSILTVGDGMVAQIPALLGAMSAGLIVTRATDEKSDKHLGDSIQKQLTSIPRVSLVAGGICCLMAFVPGFPSGVFIILGLMLLASGILLIPVWRNRLQQASKPTFDAIIKSKEKSTRVPVGSSTESIELQAAVPLLLQLPSSWGKDNTPALLIAELDEVLQELQLNLGFKLPAINFHWTSSLNDKWQLLAYEVPIAQSESAAGDPLSVIPSAVHQALRRHATLFLGLQETSFLLAQASDDNPDIVKEALRVVPMQNLAAIFRNLIEEEIPIRNLRSILEALIDAGQHEKDINNLTEFVRIALSRQISYRFAPQGVLRALALSPELEDRLLQSLRVTAGKVQLSMDPMDVEAIISTLVEAVRQHNPTAIVVNVQVRKYVRKLIELDCFDFPVLSHNELVSTVHIDVIDRVGLPKIQHLESA